MNGGASFGNPFEKHRRITEFSHVYLPVLNTLGVLRRVCSAPYGRSLSVMNS